jgi:muconate cycloisomerase
MPAAWRAGNRNGLIEGSPYALWQSPSPAAMAMEMALLDWAGKRLGCRVVDLLGGAVREWMPVDYWCARQTPDDLVKIVSEARARGFTGLKTKSRFGDPIVEQAQAVRQAGGPDFNLTIDPMGQWLSPHHGLVILQQLEKFGPNLRVEDPFPKDRPEFWQRARQVSSVPLILHAGSLDVLRRGLQDRFADDYNCSGGVLEFMTLAHAVEVAGHCCWHGSGIEMGVAQVAHLHAAAAARACTLHSDFCSPLIRQHTLITWDWPFRDGCLPLPDGPGLGVELDYGAIDRFLQTQATYQ